MLDNAVFAFGSALKNELAAVEGKNAKEVERKSQRVMRSWLGDDAAPKRFRDPGKKV